MITYKLFIDSMTAQVASVYKITDELTWSVPFDNANSDFVQFKKNLADGAELQDAEGNVIDGIAYLKELA
jgi:hypothetical protein